MQNPDQQSSQTPTRRRLTRGTALEEAIVFQPMPRIPLISPSTMFSMLSQAAKTCLLHKAECGQLGCEGTAKKGARTPWCSLRLRRYPRRAFHWLNLSRR